MKLTIYLLIFSSILYSTVAQDVLANKSGIQRNFDIIDYIIMNSHSKDSIVEVLTNQHLSGNFQWNNLTPNDRLVQSLSNYLSDNECYNGYIRKDTIFYDDTKEKPSSQIVLVISQKTKDSILFFFAFSGFYNGKDYWKLTYIKYCQYCQEMKDKKAYDIMRKRNFQMIDEIMKKSENLDSLMSLFSDSTVTSSGFRINNNSVELDSKWLSEHYDNYQYKDGYNIEKDTLMLFGSEGVGYLWHLIKIRSLKTNDIIRLSFYNREYGIWKLGGIDYCSTYRDPEHDNISPPCEKW